MILPNRLARIGLEFLEEAILEILTKERKRTGWFLSNGEISSRLGLPMPESLNSYKNGIVVVLTRKLMEEGRLEYAQAPIGWVWRLTDEEYNDRLNI